MIARPYANLAPERFRPAFEGLVFVLAIVGIAAMALQYFMPAPWEGTVSQLFFFAMAFNFAVWPNGRGVSPLASRVVGGAAVIILLINLITYIRHL